MTYKEFTTKSLQEFEELAKVAEKLGCLDEFLNKAWVGACHLQNAGLDFILEMTNIHFDSFAHSK